LRWFEISTGLPDSKGPPSSLVQLRIAVRSGGARDTRPVADVPRTSSRRDNLVGSSTNQIDKMKCRDPEFRKCDHLSDIVHPKAGTAPMRWPHLKRGPARTRFRPRGWNISLVPGENNRRRCPRHASQPAWDQTQERLRHRHVGNITAIAAAQSHSIRVLHEPEDDNKAHVAVRRW